MSTRFTLITGRTKEQGEARHAGKESPAYSLTTTWLGMGVQDMAHLGIAEGQVVRAQTEAGQADLVVHARELPTGTAFVPVGPAASELCGSQTDGTGMPLLKGLSLVIAECSAGQAKQAPARPR